MLNFLIKMQFVKSFSLIFQLKNPVFQSRQRFRPQKKTFKKNPLANFPKLNIKFLISTITFFILCINKENSCFNFHTYVFPINCTNYDELTFIVISHLQYSILRWQSAPAFEWETLEYKIYSSIYRNDGCRELSILLNRYTWLHRTFEVT